MDLYAKPDGPLLSTRVTAHSILCFSSVLVHSRGFLPCLVQVEELSHLLDIEHPWQLIIRDPSGRSILKPMDGVTKVYDGEPTAAVQA